MLIDKEEAQAEFESLHKIFYHRYLNGLSVHVTAERNHISEDLVSQESSKAIIQFVSALELLEFR